MHCKAFELSLPSQGPWTTMLFLLLWSSRSANFVSTVVIVTDKAVDFCSTNAMQAIDFMFASRRTFVSSLSSAKPALSESKHCSNRSNPSFDAASALKKYFSSALSVSEVSISVDANVLSISAAGHGVTLVWGGICNTLCRLIYLNQFSTWTTYYSISCRRGIQTRLLPSSHVGSHDDSQPTWVLEENGRDKIPFISLKSAVVPSVRPVYMETGYRARVERIHNNINMYILWLYLSKTILILDF